MLEPVESVPSSPGKHPSACSILVVDDERSSGELIATLLRSQGYGVRLVCDGREGLALIARGGIDLVLLDLMMSRMDGVEICAHVRNELHDTILPIVITTSLNDRESRIRAKEAGADDVLVKPIDGLELLVRINSLLRARSHANQLVRERDQLREELARALTVIGNQQRALRNVAHVADELRGLFERPRPGSEMQRVAQIAAQLRELGGGAADSAELSSELTPYSATK